MISKLNKINIISLKAHRQKILAMLQNLGQAEIRSIGQRPDKKDLEEKIEKLNLKLSNINFALSFLQKYKPDAKQSLWEKMAGSKKPELFFKELKTRFKKIALNQFISKIQRAEEDMNNFENRLNRLKQEKSEIEPWKKLNTLSFQTRHFKIIFGQAPLNNYLQLIGELDKQIQNSAYEIIYKDDKFVYLRIAFDKNAVLGSLRSLLNKHKFEMREILIKNPKKYFAGLRIEIKKIKSDRKIQKQALKDLAKQIPDLELAYDYLSFNKDKLEAQKKILSTKYFTIISIWIRKQVLPKLKEQLKKIDKNIILQQEQITDKDKPPVIIENKSFIKPFESVTNIYGLPKFNEIDPTAFLAPFFILFFALCLTDAGYGLVMAILCFIAIKIMKIPKENQKLFRLLIYAGMLTFIVGALFGGWFGIDLDSLPSSQFKDFLLKIRIINPMTDTLLFMGLTFVLGFIQIWFSQIVKLYQALKFNNKDQAAEAGLWALFLVSLPMSFALKSFWPGLGCLFILIMLANRKINIFIRPLIGLITVLQGLIGFMSDILSYSRLMALGLATGIIGFIINIIAGIFRDLIPFFGWGIWILVLVGGHLFNISINALGGFIHSARLQFVEFFPKFLEGGGRKFEPLQYKAKFVKIKNYEK